MTGDKTPIWAGLPQPVAKHLAGRLVDLQAEAEAAKTLPAKGVKLEEAKRIRLIAVAAGAKYYAQQASKCCVLIEADIAAATPPMPPKKSGALKGKKRYYRDGNTFFSHHSLQNEEGLWRLFSQGNIRPL